MSIIKLGTEVRREQIAQAALALIASQGVNGLNMMGLARRVGLGASSLYRHFASKDQVLDAVIDLLRERLLGNLVIAVQEATNPLEQLRRLLALHMRLILEYQALPRLFFSGDLYAGRPERKEKLYGIVKTYLGEVSAIIRKGQEENSIRLDLDPAAVAVVFLGLIQPTAILWHLSDGEFNVGKQVEQAWPIFIEAIRVR
ncbi:MAG TPA: TetR/AcrR family transcriptional regulator [Syntrophobacteraceae bacterium]|nr:TetR/AcrR family transcriptional regulator [Syntrophobacteraceae bacterium]